MPIRGEDHHPTLVLNWAMMPIKFGVGALPDVSALSHSRNTAAWFCRRDFSAGADLEILASISASIRGNATASGTRSWSR